MTTVVIEIIVLSIGILIMTVGTIGLLRLPSTWSRLHTSTQCDTLGIGSVLLAMTLQVGWSYNMLRILIIGVFVLLASATNTHVIGRSRMHRS